MEAVAPKTSAGVKILVISSYLFIFCYQTTLFIYCTDYEPSGLPQLEEITKGFKRFDESF